MSKSRLMERLASDKVLSIADDALAARIGGHKQRAASIESVQAGERFGRDMARDLSRYAGVVKSANIKAE